jgi:hypothetical protein
MSLLIGWTQVVQGRGTNLGGGKRPLVARADGAFEPGEYGRHAAPVLVAKPRGESRTG